MVKLSLSRAKLSTNGSLFFEQGRRKPHPASTATSGHCGSAKSKHYFQSFSKPGACRLKGFPVPFSTDNRHGAQYFLTTASPGYARVGKGSRSLRLNEFQ